MQKEKMLRNRLRNKKMQRMFLSLFLLTGFFSINSQAQAEISFTDGKWESTFNCNDWIQNEVVDCDGLSNGGNWFTTNGSKDEIKVDANNPAGVGKGLRHVFGEGDNNNGGGLNLMFPSDQTELWIRWYERHEAGVTFDPLNYIKELFIYTHNGYAVIPEPKGSNDWQLAIQGPPSASDQIKSTNFGWNSINGGAAGSGAWHSYEIHIKMDTNGANGVGRLWIDGILRAENTAVNYSDNNSVAKQGWYYMRIGSNQATVRVGADSYRDYDDIIIYNTTPPNLDAGGKSFIGPIGYGDVIAPSAPSGLFVQ